MTIHAYTQPHNDYPGYVNLSERPSGLFTLTVRSQGNGGRDTGSIVLSSDELRKLINDASMHLDGEPEPPAPDAAHAGYSTMQPHQQRVVDERAELDDKLSKLAGFFGTDLFATLPSAEQQRLRTQAVAMRTYSSILAERIAAFALPAAA